MSVINILLEIKKINTNLYNYLIEVTDKIMDLKTVHSNSVNCNNALDVYKINNEIMFLLDDYQTGIISVKEFVKQFMKDVDRQIHKTCSHEIVEDDIDIGENSKRIRYCTICETTFH